MLTTTRVERNGHEAALSLAKGGSDCPQCSRPIPPDAPMGVCPVCLLGIGIDALRGAFDDAADPDATVPQPRRRPPEPEGEEILFGRYKKIKKLGANMGEVWEVYDIVADRNVALKWLAVANPLERRLFKDQIRALAKLDHPYVVPIYEAGEHRGQLYFTMKLYPSDLKAQLRRFEGDPRGAADLVRKLALGVQHLQDRGILHRDLKPANVLMDVESPPNPCIADFGIAKIVTEDTPFTAGMVMGTKPYMAPEQEAAEDLTLAADVYSLGVILYELLTRERLPTRTPMEIREADRWPPKGPRQLDRRVDRHLEQICLRCLDRDAEHRYRSAGALAEALRRYLAGEPGEGAGRVERAWRWGLRHAVTTGILVAVISFLGLAASRVVALLGAQEAQKRQQVRELHTSTAAMVAGTVLAQMRTYSDAVLRVASDAELVDALERGDQPRMQEYCERTYAYYDDPAHLPSNGIPALNMWYVLDASGTARAQFGPGNSSTKNIGKDYSWRDYFLGAKALGERGLRLPHIARAIKSENDGYHKFVISAPIYGKGGQMAGVLAIGIATKADLGSLVLDDTQSIAVLVAPRDRDRASPVPDHPFLILRHPAYHYGEAIGMDDPLLRKVSEPDLEGERRLTQALWLPTPGRATSTDHYADPVAATHSEYTGNLLAAFAPVGNTGFVVIVQSREEDAAKGERTLVWQLGKWIGVSAVPGFAFMAVLMGISRWRRRRVRGSARTK